ncbi:type II toxin-antitoxin system YoeB family toxin [Candidatus Pacearchaeota archaeon]|nr:type II toxin-antitoxin system YoeB family toxin [Candidatus Pacearchaeota archaeon]
MKSELQFANSKVGKAFEKLKNSDEKLYNFICRAFKDIEENVFCGIQIPKKLIPKDYVRKFNVKNVWKYNLPGAWRLLYSIEGKNLVVLSIVLEWMDHKTYERLFKYNK